MRNYVDIPAPTQGWILEYEPLIWAKQNCPSYITNDCIQRGGNYYYRFFFGNDRDCVMFTLKWA